MEHGFFHPERGYWQAIDIDPEAYLITVAPERVEIAEDGSQTIIPAVTRQTTQLAELLASYPEGTVEVPLMPGADHEWNGEAWVYVAPPEPTPEDHRAALPPITRRQLRLTLVRNGVSRDDVAAMIEAMPEGLAKEEARIEWDDASQFERLHPTLVLIGDGLGMTPEQVDELWAEAMGA